MESTVIEKRDRLFNPLSFILRARSTDDTRLHLQLLHVEDGKSICTDGKRLHIYTGETLADGDYKIDLVGKDKMIFTPTKDYTFPDWKRVMPEKENCKKVDGKLNMESSSLKKSQLHALSKNHFAFIKNTDCLIDLSHFSALSGHSWKVYHQEDNNKSVLFENNTFTAVIIPMRQVD